MYRGQSRDIARRMFFALWSSAPLLSSHAIPLGTPPLSSERLPGKAAGQWLSVKVTSVPWRLLPAAGRDLLLRQADLHVGGHGDIHHLPSASARRNAVRPSYRINFSTRSRRHSI